MVKSMREGLFVAYSRADAKWRDRFVKHLESVVSDSILFVDRDSIPAGADWKQAIAGAINHARCALLLLTDPYLKVGGTARASSFQCFSSANRT